MWFSLYIKKGDEEMGDNLLPFSHYRVTRQTEDGKSLQSPSDIHLSTYKRQVLVYVSEL